MELESVELLLAQAVEVCKTKRALASRLGVSEQNLQGLMAGRRHLNAQQVIALANVLGMDATRVLALATVARAKDPVERGRLLEGFFRRGIAGAVVIFGIYTTLHGGSVDSGTASQRLTIYTLYAVACAVIAQLRLALWDWHQGRALERTANSR